MNRSHKNAEAISRLTPRRYDVTQRRSNVVASEDRSHGMLRTEVRSAHGDSHLGHVFDDGPAEEGVAERSIN